VELMTIFRVVIPFVFVQLLTVFTLYMIPQIATLLPSKM
jgi:TRAP-type mannitol/chloroaromatic compound transport system permease large subunit